MISDQRATSVLTTLTLRITLNPSTQAINAPQMTTVSQNPALTALASVCLKSAQNAQMTTLAPSQPTASSKTTSRHASQSKRQETPARKTISSNPPLNAGLRAFVSMMSAPLDTHFLMTPPLRLTLPLETRIYPIFATLITTSSLITT